MSGLLLGLVMGLGLFCIYWSFWPAEPEPVREGRHGRLARLADDLAQAELRSVTATQLVIGSVVVGFLVLALVLLLTSVPAIAACFAVMAGMAPVVAVRARARRRRRLLRDVWPEVVDNVASGVRAGLALPEALAQLGVRGPEALRPAFAAFGDDYRLTGRFNDCLDALKERLSDPVADRLVESLRIAREVGGTDLGTLLRTLSSFLREDARTRAELETRQGWTVNAARLAVASPWLVLATMMLRPSSVAAYGTWTGALVLAAGAGVTLLAYHLMVRIGRLSEEPRVLR